MPVVCGLPVCALWIFMPCSDPGPVNAGGAPGSAPSPGSAQGPHPSGHTPPSSPLFTQELRNLFWEEEALLVFSAQMPEEGSSPACPGPHINKAKASLIPRAPPHTHTHTHTLLHSRAWIGALLHNPVDKVSPRI